MSNVYRKLTEVSSSVPKSETKRRENFSVNFVRRVSRMILQKLVPGL